MRIHDKNDGGIIGQRSSMYTSNETSFVDVETLTRHITVSSSFVIDLVRSRGDTRWLVACAGDKGFDETEGRYHCSIYF